MKPTCEDAATELDPGVSEGLQTRTVTLLLADIADSARLWESHPDEMTAALARLDRTVTRAIASHEGVRPIAQEVGDGFIAAFARASDAVACALDVQRASLAPIRLRIAVHTGEVQLRDNDDRTANFTGPTITSTAGLRDLAHGGQTVLSGTTEPLVVDHLPEGAWLTDLGSHRLPDLPRPERVVQLCHPGLRIDFPPPRGTNSVAAHNLPGRFTSFVGRRAEMVQLRRILAENRMVTLTGAGGAGKTRLAVEIAATLETEFPGGVRYVDLAPIKNPAVVAVRVASALGLPDVPGRSTIDTVLRFVGDKTMLVLVDNCEHLLDACAGMVVELLGACPRLTILATSREPLGVPGELSWRVPSLAVAGEAVDLFIDRARHARPEFQVGDNAALVGQICQRLDGMPLAIELAAARVRALSVSQLVDSLHDRFRVLTGGARTALRRQQTLRASVDWSHQLLTEPERVVFRRLAVFVGGFDLDAAQAIGASDEAERYQLLDQLGLLVDKSLVVAEEGPDGMRYRLLETMRQYALEKLAESDEADEVRTRHRDYYTTTAAMLESRVQAGAERLLGWADVEIDNLRAAFVWSREMGDDETALRLVSSLQPFWKARSRMREGLAGFDAVLTDQRPAEIAPEVWVRAVADHGTLAGWVALPASLDRAREALATARQLDDPALIARALTGCAMLAFSNPEVALPYYAEAIDLIRPTGDRWTLCQLLRSQADALMYAGEPIKSRAAAEEGRELADSLGDQFVSRGCRTYLGMALAQQGDLTRGERTLGSVAEEAKADGDLIMQVLGGVGRGFVLAHQGQVAAAQAAAESALETIEAMGGFYSWLVYPMFVYAALADGDTAATREAFEAARLHPAHQRDVITKHGLTEAVLANGDVAAARRWADDTVAVTTGWHRMAALTVRAFVAITQGEPDQAERDAHDALAIAARTQGFLRLPDTLECLARLAVDADNQHYAARLFGAAHAIRKRTGQIRFPMYQAGHEAALAATCHALGQQEFDIAWAEGLALSPEEVIAYAQRRRGERKRPSRGWESLTPTERDVVRLVSDGLGNKDIAERLFISPRTVQTHLTHVYAKLGLTSRVQLVHEAARHT